MFVYIEWKSPLEPYSVSLQALFYFRYFCHISSQDIQYIFCFSELWCYNTFWVYCGGCAQHVHLDNWKGISSIFIFIVCYSLSRKISNRTLQARDIEVPAKVDNNTPHNYYLFLSVIIMGKWFGNGDKDISHDSCISYESCLFFMDHEMKILRFNTWVMLLQTLDLTVDLSAASAAEEY